MGFILKLESTGSNVKNPKRLKMKAGDAFPENSNGDRIWTYQRKP